ncbi:MAG: SAM-dependent methyltransferase [Lachnospiraceae bacterium]|nr:SAM-dependent methyltransferase [Lachnospiraceae bacterium]
MEELQKVLQEVLNRDLEHIILSNTTDKEYATKIKIRPVELKGELLFQQTLYRGTQVFHHNYNAEEIAQQVTEALSGKMKQAELKGNTLQATVLVSKKGKMTVKVKRVNAPAESKNRDLSHNREKQYILREGEPVDFLVGLGVQTPEGKIAKNRYDKFRQINRYLEFIEDILDKLPKDRTIRIIDFGCGKSYLTFAMYYYLHQLQGRDIAVTGLDLKKDVIAHCNELAQKCGYDKLTFEVGDISTYQGENSVDMVVSLHACDTATDYALEKAVKWGAQVILAVPCCQHELNRQMKNDLLAPVLKYGLIKEKVAALITDAIRANLLEQQGYDTQILEFIDMEHTPKNLLIRAVKRSGGVKKSMKPGQTTIEETMEGLHVDPTLAKLLK